ncbi:MAG: tetratricopeptide repeat protein [Cyanobacteria bacterium]|nr:tetratricopeptide repeat protein [Cyanobacteriota bacterium]MDW8199706.1 tetratricopeptide repeat protein [Cyanobacteriota bacterium SKYGB_h_bin112]
MPKSKKLSKSKQAARGFWSSSHTQANHPTIRDAKALAARGRFRDAQQVLDYLVKQSPQRIDLWQELADVSRELQDATGYERACEHLVELDPTPDHLMGLLAAYLQTVRPMLAIQTCHRLLATSPDLGRAEDIQRTLKELQAKSTELLQEIGLSGEDAQELAALHEQMQVKMEQGNIDAALRVADELLARKPDFVPALNNLSMMQYLRGDVSAAIATAERTLTIDPHNAHALSNLIRYLHFAGRTDEAMTYVDRLKAVDTSRAVNFIKQAEALSYLGLDQDVLNVAEIAAKSGFQNGLLSHFAGAAALRLGHHDDARRYWQQAVKLTPYLEIAQENLDDLSKPIGQRHAPYAFRLMEWLLSCIWENLAAKITANDDRTQEETVAIAQAFLQDHPEFQRMAPTLLERGDKLSREAVIYLAKASRSPELLALLREFAFSQWGSDESRHSAAIVAQEAGLIPPGRVRMWLQGEWRDIYLMSFEITNEPQNQLSPKAQKLLERSLTLLRQQKGVEAEKLLKEALDLEPDAPSLYNNLAVAYTIQDRTEEAEALIHEIHERFPDYVLGRTALAKFYAHAGEFDRANELLQPLFSYSKFHVAEYSALCDAQITILHAKGELDGATAWVKMWQNVTPDHPTLRYWQYQLTSKL